MKKIVQSLFFTLVVSLGLVGPLAAFAAGPTAPNLLSLLSNNFVVFGETGVTDATPASTAITGNVGTSLVANPAVTGLSCTELAGSSKIYILSTAGYPGGWDLNPACLLVNDVLVANAVGDITTAYNDAAAARIPTVVGLGGGTLPAQTIVPGTYKWATGVTITGNVTLAGGANDVWIFQIAGNLDIQNGFKILLSGGAQAKNVYWAVAGNTTLLPNSVFEGNILGWSFIAMQLGATLHGRALSHTQVTLIGNTITAPSSAITAVPAGRRTSTPIVPLIGVLKVPTPLALPGGAGDVTYNYTVWNVGGRQPLVDVTLVDDKCSPVVLVSGDIENNHKLDIDENWKYTCTTRLNTTTTNTAIATGYSDDGYHNTAVATAIATVAVGTQVPPPIIHIVKVPNQLTPFPFGGGDVTYTYTVTNPGVVAMNNVKVTDDKCSTVSFVSGDNGNNLLEVGESWIYTCKARVQVSTGSVATAKGDANGFTALAYAFVNVLVSAPVLPDTGFTPEGISWTTGILSGIIILLGTALVIVSRERKI